MGTIRQSHGLPRERRTSSASTSSATLLANATLAEKASHAASSMSASVAPAGLGRIAVGRPDHDDRKKNASPTGTPIAATSSSHNVVVGSTRTRSGTAR
jgi:hypothetical protein